MIFSAKSLWVRFLRKQNAKKNLDIVSYEDSNLTQYIVDKTENYLQDFSVEKKLRSTDMLILLAYGLCKKKQNLVILDFGGGAGIHYGIFKQVYPEVKVNWLIIENPTMKQMSQNRIQHVQYFSDLKDVVKDYSKIDIVFANSSLQYVSEPLAVIDQLINLSPEIFFIARTAMDNNRSFSSSQRSKLESNGPGSFKSSLGNTEISYPITVLRESDYLGKFSRHELVFRIDEGILSGIEGKQSSCNLTTLVYRLSNQQ